METGREQMQDRGEAGQGVSWLPQLAPLCTLTLGDEGVSLPLAMAGREQHPEQEPGPPRPSSPIPTAHPSSSRK